MRGIYYLIHIFISFHYFVLFHVGFYSFPNCIFPMLFSFASYKMFCDMISSDPGMIRQDQLGNTIDTKHCKHCGFKVSLPSRHCRISGSCVDGFDHYCDVLEICIGNGNILLFKTFLAFHSLLCFYGVASQFHLLLTAVNQGMIYTSVCIFGMMFVELVFGISFLLFFTFMILLMLGNMKMYQFILVCKSFKQKSSRGKTF